MLARLYSVTLEGIEGITCEVEVDVARGGLEKSVIVGLPDAAVKESIERVKSAIINSGYRYPKTQSLVNLAPADVKKAGPAFDLPIALGMLIGKGAIVSSVLNNILIVGELALDGRVRLVNGVLSMAMTAASNGFRQMIVPLENAQEAAVVADIDVFGVGSLAQAASSAAAAINNGLFIMFPRFLCRRYSYYYRWLAIFESASCFLRLTINILMFAVR